jgi:hypothetical protein
MMKFVPIRLEINRCIALSFNFFLVLIMLDFQPDPTVIFKEIL